MKVYYLLLVPIFCLSSDKSDQLPNFNTDHAGAYVTQSVVINCPPVVVTHPKPAHKHPAVEAAHEAARRRQEEDDFITCCCFLKIKKPMR
jgi:hypothetical protein